MRRALTTLRAPAVAACFLATALHGTIGRAGPLGDLASSMQPGTFAELTPMTGWSSGGILNPLDVSGCATSDYITQYSDKAAWDPVNKRVLFLGQTHGACYAGRFVIYDETLNSWSQGPWLSAICQSGTSSSPCFNHGYEHSTADPATGDYYYRHYGSLKFFRFRNGAWSALPSPAAQSANCCGTIEFFGAMNRLIFVDGDWGVWAYNPAANNWTELANTNQANVAAGLPNCPMAEYENFAAYDPVHKVLLFGGGKNLYRMTADGAISTARTPPVSLTVSTSVMSLDSAGGNLIVLSGSSMYQYDVVNDSWSQLSVTVPSVLQALGGVGDGLVAADVTTYGVIMYIKYDFASSKVYLYKNSASVGAKAIPPSPAPPTNVAVR